MNHSDTLIAWLNDAHAMEEALIPFLENHAQDARDYPQIQQRIQQHAEITRRHSELLEQALEQHGETPSAAKSALGKMFGGMQSVTTGMFADQLVKNALLDFATENFEIASYKALIAAAQAAGESHITEICQRILQDEQEMAGWLEQQLPVVVQQTMQKMAT